MEETDNDFVRKNEYLYKYRSLSNPKRFLEILVNNKLYGALFTELNDPMEGYFTYSPNLDKSTKDRLKSARKSTYICSFSKRNNIGLLWAHYADEYKGVCIKLKVKSAVWKRLEVDYTETKLRPNEKITNTDLFKFKSAPWSYEEEVRYVNYPKAGSKQCARYLVVEIAAIYMGYKMDDKEFNMWKKVIKKIDERIDVKKIKKKDLDFGFK